MRWPRRSPRKASSSWARPSVTPSCRRRASSTTMSWVVIAAKGVDFDQACFHRGPRDRDQSVRALPDRPARLPGTRHLARRRDEARADQLHRAAACLAQGDREARLDGDRGARDLRRALRHDGAQGLRGFPRRDPGRREGRPAARRRADQRARRHGGRRLRRLRGRPALEDPRHRRAQGGDRRRVRPALPPERAHARQRRRAGGLQGIPAHRHDGARGRAVRDHRRHGRGQGEARHGALRLPHDRAVPHLGAADQRVRGPHEVARRQGRHPLRVA